jgi:hypothetical protein
MFDARLLNAGCGRLVDRQERPLLVVKRECYITLRPDKPPAFHY